MLKIFGAFLLSLCFFVFYFGCTNPVDYTYDVKKRNDISNLLVFCYGSNIFGIDTTDFTIKTHITINDMSFGGVAKLPSGGIAFTHRRRASNNAWANSLYVTDKDCNLLGTYEICYSPMAPKVVNNLLLIGSNAIEPGVTYKFQIYDTDNFNLKKEYMFLSDIDAWNITMWNNKKVYFGIHRNNSYPNLEYSYIMELDLNSFETTTISHETDFFLGAYLLAIRHNSLLYIFNILKKNICIYDFTSKSIVLTMEEHDYPQIATFQADRLVLPHIYNGFLYAILGRNNSNGDEISCLAKMDLASLELINFLPLETRAGYTSNAHHFYAGRFLIRQLLRDTHTEVIFYDIETGRIEHEVTFNGKEY